MRLVREYTHLQFYWVVLTADGEREREAIGSAKPNARVPGCLADAVVLGIRSDEASQDATRSSLLRIKENGTPILGTILNEWDPRGGGSNHCSYYYRYGKDELSS